MKMHQICHTRVNHCTFQHLRNLVPELWEEEPKYRAKTANPVQEALFHGRTGGIRGGELQCEAIYRHLAH